MEENRKVEEDIADMKSKQNGLKRQNSVVENEKIENSPKKAKTYDTTEATVQYN